jgi:hypothetical protein
MTQSKKLIRRQAALIEDLFAGTLEEHEVLRKHHVSASLFERWLGDERFLQQFERRIDHAYRQSRMVLASHAPKAATKLMQLMESQSQETARKACLDILALHAAAGGQGSPDAPVVATAVPSARVLSPETASRLLAALARAEPRTEANST